MILFGGFHDLTNELNDINSFDGHEWRVVHGVKKYKTSLRSAIRYKTIERTNPFNFTKTKT